MLTAWTAFPMLDRIFDDVMNGVGGTALGTGPMPHAYAPAVDVRASPDELVFVFDVPGLKQEDIDVSIDARTLRVSGERRYDGSDKDKVWLGRSYGRFEKSFTLPDHVDSDHMSADLADGVLTIHVPKKPQAKPRRIQIGSAAHNELTAKTG